MTLGGALLGLQPWTAEEDEVLVRLYAAGGVKAAAAALSHRSKCSIMHRAERLGCYRRRRWTAEDDRKLRNLWDEPHSIDEIAKALGRTRYTTYWRAQLLKLPFGPPQGCEYLYAAARRCGFPTTRVFRRVLRFAGVRIRACRTRRGNHAGHFYVDSFDADEAVERWMKTETAEAAARRLGINGDRLRARLRKLGIETGRDRHARLTEEQIEAANAIAEWPKGHRRAA